MDKESILPPHGPVYRLGRKLFFLNIVLLTKFYFSKDKCLSSKWKNEVLCSKCLPSSLNNFSSSYTILLIQFINSSYTVLFISSYIVLLIQFLYSSSYRVLLIQFVLYSSFFYNSCIFFHVQLLHITSYTVFLIQFLL